MEYKSGTSTLQDSQICLLTYLLTYSTHFFTEQFSAAHAMLQLRKKNTIVYAICIRFNSLRYAILTDLHLNNVVINVV